MQGKIKALFGAQDMTTGNPMRNLLRFSVPLLIGNFAQQTYSTVDAIIVGKYVGDEALAAVGASNPIVFLLLILMMAISSGAGIMVSQYFGAKDKKLLSKTIGTSVVMVFLASVVITALGVTLSPKLLSFLGTPDNIFDMARQYLTIIFIGTVASAFYNIISGILRGMGDSVTPLLFLLLATLLNTVLDVYFVRNLGWGVAGAAWATIFSQAVSATLCIRRLFQIRDTVDMNRETIRLDKALALQLLKLGIPAGLTQAVFSLAQVAVQRLTNSMGSDVVAVTTVVMRVDGFAMLPNFTFGMAIATFVGQNIGAGLMDRVDRGSRDGAKLTFLTSSALTLCLLLFGKNLATLFTQTEAIIELAGRMFRILAVGYIAMGLSQVFAGILRGAGDTMPSLWISIITTVAIRVPVAYCIAFLTRSELHPNGSPDALYISLLTAWISGAIINYLWFRRGKWRDKSIIGKVR
ncbi:MAG: MATE family efflux transporter [Christensenellales bacterium]|jgi:putative MATE family efflux protein